MTASTAWGGGAANLRATMPDIEAGGARLHYADSGSGAETVVMSHSYLLDHRHFAPQVEALGGRYRVLAYDHRDHGASARSAGPYGVEDLYADAVGFLEATGAVPCHWVGLSTGGFLGLRLAIRRPELLQSLVVMSAAANPEPRHRRLKYSLMLTALRWAGFGPVLGGGMKALFGRSWLRDPERAEERETWRRRITANDRAALVRFGRAIFGREGVEPLLAGVRVPTLVMVGEEDGTVGVERARRTAAAIPGARFEVVPRAGHLLTLEQPQAVNRLLDAFLAGARAP